MSPDTLQRPLVDHRIYTIRLRRMGEFLEVFNRLALPILMQTLAHPLGFYISQVGPLNQFVHLWAYTDLADYERRSQQRDAHPGFPAYLAASEHLIVAQETRLIRSAPMSGWIFSAA
ncbi:NIPSNAP family protein [Diaphorobacter sp. HDW4A]|uniref:NIPSNAP family protein n=1 Tax=Diaphorobacter sp. HDW4A TaxID=2714924 RepID=UPI00140728E5|nr:NIPSNAP family protein [Diaphorobacter sp. HDW4A]QIL82406.1 NIPSNAP family protein [Diaphorobacter sp. HDW4A]